MGRVLADPKSAVPDLIRDSARMLVEEIRLLEARIAQVERELSQAARLSPAYTLLLSVPGVGLLTATAMVAATSGDVTHYKDARHFASWFGLMPLRQWAVQLQVRSNHNKATCALANKLARICYATLRDQQAFDEAAAAQRKLQRQSFAMPA